jgi:hypothetical protein
VCSVYPGRNFDTSDCNKIALWESHHFVTIFHYCNLSGPYAHSVLPFAQDRQDILVTKYNRKTYQKEK